MYLLSLRKVSHFGKILIVCFYKLETLLLCDLCVLCVNPPIEAQKRNHAECAEYAEKIQNIPLQALRTLREPNRSTQKEIAQSSLSSQRNITIPQHETKNNPMHQMHGAK